LSTADSMRKLEAAQSHQWVTTQQSRKEIPFVRSAKSGQWQQSLPSSSVAEIESAWEPVMKLLGYPLRSEMETVSSSAQKN